MNSLKHWPTADDVIVTGIFPAREKQEDYPTISSATIVDEALKLDHTPAEDWIRGVEDMHTAAQMMTMRAHHGDVIFTVGAGDITQMDEVMLHSLQAHRWDCEADDAKGHQFRYGFGWFRNDA